MAGSLPFAVRNRWRPSARFLFRVGRRTLVESLYLLTVPITAAAGLLLALGGLCVGTAGLLLPGGAGLVTGALAPARWFADLERWRIAKVRSPAGRAAADPEPRPKQITPGLWLDAAHAVAVLPVVLVTSLVTGLWWFIGVMSATIALRGRYTPGSLRPMLTLSATSYHARVAWTLGLTTPDGRTAFGTVLGLLLLCTLPLVTRACVAAQAGLGQALLSDTSALHRRSAAWSGSGTPPAPRPSRR